ncbi:hypothetical protein AB9N12_16300 [Bacteroides sp. AN502(2024)]|uniref:hypothetical protein n=1 Tax=Bacteroides sp. AN502(2024) TaxID=3160599 RepID=UPI003515B7A9
MQADFKRFKGLKTAEEKEAFKKEMQDKYHKLPEAQKEAYKKASEAGLKATVSACNDYIERAEEAILRNKRKHSVNHVFSSPPSIINFTSKKPSYDDTRRSSRNNELLQRAQSDL